MEIIPKKSGGRGSAVDDIAGQCRSFMSRCRARGIRVTTQRMAVFQALVGEASHATADSVYAVLHRTMPSLSLSTVYRVLESLEREGLIRRVSSANGSARFDANLNPHQHLVCRTCGRMTDLDDALLSRIRLPANPFDGFIAEELEIRIIGTCLNCRRTAPRVKH